MAKPTGKAKRKAKPARSRRSARPARKTGKKAGRAKVGARAPAGRGASTTAANRRLAELEEENRRLRDEVRALRSQLEQQASGAGGGEPGGGVPSMEL